MILGDHVTLDRHGLRTHCPGHGLEDFDVCRRYDLSGKTNIGVVVPVDDRGYMNEDAGKYCGMLYSEANKAIFADLKETGALLASETIVHQYPHCWRCKSPVIYRATDQWFCSVDAFKEDAVKACDAVKWLPEWGHDRIVAMVRERADWCISRQRHWGLPIPVFYCEDCKKPVCTDETIENISVIFGEKGQTRGSQCRRKSFCRRLCLSALRRDALFQGKDTLDGWFDSARPTSRRSRNRSESGRRQCISKGRSVRGWFQSSRF